MSLHNRILLTFVAFVVLVSCSIDHDIKARGERMAKEREILETCYDDQGQFNENFGSDTLDCGNL